MNVLIPRVAVVHSLTGIGRSSLSVIAPTLSSQGIQCCSVPTTLLSTHTGGFGPPAAADLKTYPQNAFQHYEEQKIDFQGIYSGYFSHPDQAQHLLTILDQHPESVKLVDPVLGDKGKRYEAIDKNTVPAMRQLVAKADIITPNLTEVGLLLDRELRPPFSNKEKKDLLLALAFLGADNVIITGVPQGGHLDTLVYERDRDWFYQIRSREIPVSYPGTGDVFASVVLGTVLQGRSLSSGVARAITFLETLLWDGYQKDLEGEYSSFGIPLERHLGWFYTSQNLPRPEEI